MFTGQRRAAPLGVTSLSNKHLANCCRFFASFLFFYRLLRRPVTNPAKDWIWSHSLMTQFMTLTATKPSSFFFPGKFGSKGNEVCVAPPQVNPLMAAAPVINVLLQMDWTKWLWRPPLPPPAAQRDLPSCIIQAVHCHHVQETSACAHTSDTLGPLLSSCYFRSGSMQGSALWEHH